MKELEQDKYKIVINFTDIDLKDLDLHSDINAIAKMCDINIGTQLTLLEVYKASSNIQQMVKKITLDYTKKNNLSPDDESLKSIMARVKIIDAT